VDQLPKFGVFSSLWVHVETQLVPLALATRESSSESSTKGTLLEVRGLAPAAFELPLTFWITL
jgi:hypothetical protein